jgi:hypothetical protein
MAGFRKRSAQPQPPRGDQAIHRRWNFIERFFDEIEHLKWIAMCFDKLAAIPASSSAAPLCSGTTHPDPGEEEYAIFAPACADGKPVLPFHSRLPQRIRDFVRR